MGTESDVIEFILEKASTAKGVIGAERKYDILFTNNGIVMVLVEGAMKMGVGGFGAADVLINKAISDKKIEDKRASYAGLSVSEILRRSEKNMYYGYGDVKTVSLKKSIMGCTMAFEAGGDKYKCTFSSGQMDTANQALSKHLSAKMQ